MIQFCTSRCPSGALLCLGGPFAHAWKPAVRPAAAGAGRCCVRRLEHRHSQSASPARPRFRKPFCSVLALLSIGSWGIILYKLWTFRRAAKQSRAVPRRLPPQQQVFRSPGGLPIARRQPAGRPLPVRLRRLTAQLRQAAPDDVANGPNPRPAGRTSYSEEPHGGRSRADARVGRRSQQARKPHRRFWRRPPASRRSSGCSARSVGIMIAFEQIGMTGSTNLQSVGARHRRSAGRHGGRPRRGDSGGGLLQPPVAAREAVRVGDGRLRDGVPEHRARGTSRKCRSSDRPSAAASAAAGRGRRVADLARRDQRRAAGRRDARAADHLHGRPRR